MLGIHPAGCGHNALQASSNRTTGPISGWKEGPRMKISNFTTAKAPNKRSKIDNHGEAGASMAEFAFVLPLLIVILFSIVEFGIAFNRAQAIEAAAREGARLASLQTTTAGDIQARVNAALNGIPITLNGPPTIAPGLCAGRPGDRVTVQVAADHDVTIPLFGQRTVTLTGEAVFRCEG